MVAQQFVRPQQQFGEIDQAGTSAYVLIGAVNGQQLARVRIAAVRHVPRPDAGVLLRVDVPLQWLSRPFGLIQLQRVKQALDNPKLVGGIHHLESIGQPGLRRVSA